MLLKAFQVLDSDQKGYLTQEEITKYMVEEGKVHRLIRFGLECTGWVGGVLCD